MKNNLLLHAVSKYLAGFLLISMLLFLPAGTMNYPHAWLLIAVLFIPMLILGIILYIQSPELLEKRLRSKETDRGQRAVVCISGLQFLLMFVSAGLDRRFSWSHVPCWITWTAVVTMLLAYAMYAEVMRENAYLSRVIEINPQQKVIDRGLYGVVRHPMYASTILLFLSMPLVLGSAIALIPILPYPLIISFRIRREEHFLRSELEGYAAYCDRIRYRLIPYIW